MKTLLAACAVAAAGFATAEAPAAKPQNPPPPKCEARPPCPMQEGKMCERTKPLSLILAKDVKDADIAAFKQSVLAKIDEAAKAAKERKADDKLPPTRLVFISDDGRQGPPPGMGFGRGPQGRGFQGRGFQGRGPQGQGPRFGRQQFGGPQGGMQPPPPPPTGMQQPPPPPPTGMQQPPPPPPAGMQPQGGMQPPPPPPAGEQPQPNK